MPFFSITMPTYNQAEFITTALNSVLNQREKDVELRVYDAMSDDGTSAILEKYGSRIRWIREPDRGMVDAINKGFSASDGEVVAWLNSDDAYFPDALARVRKAFETDPDIDFVYGDAVEMDRTGRFLGPNVFTEDPVPERYLYSHNYICQPTMFVRRRMLSRMGAVRDDLRWTMDYEWFARMMLADARGVRVPWFLAANRDYAATLTNSGGAARYREMMRVHRMRPGKLLPLRKSFWVYSFEVVIKAANGLWAQQPPDSLRARLLGRFSQVAGDSFMRFVNPRSRDRIAERFRKNFLLSEPPVNTIADAWYTYGEEDVK